MRPPKRWGLFYLLLAVGSAVGVLALYGVNQWTRPKRIAQSKHPRDLGLPWIDVSFPARDGLTLRGWFISTVQGTGDRGQSADSETTVAKFLPSTLSSQPPTPDFHPPTSPIAVILCHGHGSERSANLSYALWFHARGIPVLLFDFRNHGESDGALTSMGYYERLDLLGAIDHLAARGYTQLGLLGFSMGAATAIATAPFSTHVRCVVADSAFAELPATLMMGIVSNGFPRVFAQQLIKLILWLGARRLQADLNEAWPIHAVRQFGGRALLLILGGRDKYVEAWQGERLFAAAGEPKEYWFAPEAGHRGVEKLYPEQYRKKVMAFFERWLEGKDQN